MHLCLYCKVNEPSEICWKLKPICLTCFSSIQASEKVFNAIEKEHPNFLGYYFSMTYETVSEESGAQGEVEESGFSIEPCEVEVMAEMLKPDVERDFSHLPVASTLANLLDCQEIHDHEWLEWSSTSKDKDQPVVGSNFWIVSEEESEINGDSTQYHLFIRRVDGKDLTEEEIDYINDHVF